MKNPNPSAEDPAPASCPVCDARVALSADAVAGELLNCDDCDSELEVAGVCPVVLKVMPEEEAWEEE